MVNVNKCFMRLQNGLSRKEVAVTRVLIDSRFKPFEDSIAVAAVRNVRKKKWIIIPNRERVETWKIVIWKFSKSDAKIQEKPIIN